MTWLSRLPAGFLSIVSKYSSKSSNISAMALSILSLYLKNPFHVFPGDLLPECPISCSNLDTLLCGAWCIISLPLSSASPLLLIHFESLLPKKRIVSCSFLFHFFIPLGHFSKSLLKKDRRLCMLENIFVPTLLFSDSLAGHRCLDWKAGDCSLLWCSTSVSNTHLSYSLISF